MHANDVGGDRSAQGPDLSKDKNKSIGIAKVRAKKEVLQTKSVKVITSRNAKDGNKFIPKVRQQMQRLPESLIPTMKLFEYTVGMLLR